MSKLRWQIYLQKGWNRVYYVPCNFTIARDFLYYMGNCHIKKENDYEDYIEGRLRKGVCRSKVSV
jgi:hypothetical protein